MNLPPPFVTPDKILKGVGASAGIAIGEAVVINRKRLNITKYKLKNQQMINKELVRLGKARKEVYKQIIMAKEALPTELKSQAGIFEAIILLLDDPLLEKSTVDKIKTDKVNAEIAILYAVKQIGIMLNKIEDEYIRSRFADVEILSQALLDALAEKKPTKKIVYPENSIIVTVDISPSDMAGFQNNRVVAIATIKGSRTSHNAIVAQALELPAVVGIKDLLTEINDGDTLIIDGSHGHVIINPDDDTIKFYLAKKDSEELFKTEIVRCAHLPAITLDEKRIHVLGNLELVEELAAILSYGGDGIGLYRTEFLYLTSQKIINEEKLFEVYKKIVETTAPKPITIRTLDVGSDKKLDLKINTFQKNKKTAEDAESRNQALGLRGIRFCLKHHQIFKTQLKAILRASAYGEVKILLPMISGLEEVLAVKKLITEVKFELINEKQVFNFKTPIGIMIEVPSAVVLAETLAAEVDFFSIGTNDLIQYTLAVDRVNPDVNEMYQPLHPAILKMIKYVTTAAKKFNIPVSVCSDMASGILTAPILIGLGADTLSMPSSAIPKIKRLIRMSSFQEMETWAQEILTINTAKETKQYIIKKIRNKFPEFFYSQNEE